LSCLKEHFRQQASNPSQKFVWKFGNLFSKSIIFIPTKGSTKLSESLIRPSERFIEMLDLTYTSNVCYNVLTYGQL